MKNLAPFLMAISMLSAPVSFAADSCEGYMANDKLQFALYGRHIQKLLAAGIRAEDIESASIATAVPRDSDGRLRPIAVLIVRYPFSRELEYFTLKHGLFGRPIIGYLRYAPPGTYDLSNGSVAQVVVGIHHGFFGVGPTWELYIDGEEIH